MKIFSNPCPNYRKLHSKHGPTFVTCLPCGRGRRVGRPSGGGGGNSGAASCWRSRSRGWPCHEPGVTCHMLSRGVTCHERCGRVCRLELTEVWADAPCPLCVTPDTAQRRTSVHTSPARTVPRSVSPAVPSSQAPAGCFRICH